MSEELVDADRAKVFFVFASRAMRAALVGSLGCGQAPPASSEPASRASLDTGSASVEVSATPPPPSPLATPRSAPTASAAPRGPCKPLTVTVDGASFSPKSMLAAGFATEGGAGAYVIKLSSAELSCSTILSGVTPMQRRDVHIDVGFGPNAAASQYVWFANDTGRVPTELVRAPSRVGDPVEICLREKVQLVGNLGSGQKREVEVEGLVRGSFCGLIR